MPLDWSSCFLFKKKTSSSLSWLNSKSYFLVQFFFDHCVKNLVSVFAALSDAFVKKKSLVDLIFEGKCSFPILTWLKHYILDTLVRKMDFDWLFSKANVVKYNILKNKNKYTLLPKYGEKQQNYICLKIDL